MAADPVQEIKERLSIADIIAPYVKLSRAGKSLVGLCPFHKEKTPSFTVSAERNSWHCFGCGRGGDMFSFIQEIEGVGFREALTLLAEKAGVDARLSDASGETRSRVTRLREVLLRAAAYYQGRFQGSPAEAYASMRGISPETARAWELGYAPESWRALVEALATEGMPAAELVAAGLSKEADGKAGTYYDRFRNRLMFPLKDASGRIVAFTGRILPSEKTESSPDPAKYLNSPETELFHKSEILFGMDRAKESIRARGFTLLVEGQMDVLMAHQAGFTNAVALSGTALSPRHLALIKRYSENLMLVLDADPAGLSASARSAELAFREGLRVKAVTLPEGEDPASLIERDPKLFAGRIQGAQPIIVFLLGALGERERDSVMLVRSVEKIVLPLVSAIKSPLERDHFVQVVAHHLGLSPESVRLTLPKGEASGRPRIAEAAPSAARRTPKERYDEELRALILLYAEKPLAKRVESAYTRITKTRSLPQESPSESVLFEVERDFGDDPEEDAADELIRAFERAVIREAYQEAVVQLRKAEMQGDAAVIAEAEARCAKLSAELSHLHT